MKTETKKAKGFYLKWPWNAAAYVLLAVVLRVWAIPFILLIMRWNKKQQPEGPEEGYCLQRTRKRLVYLVWAALFLAIGVVGIVAFAGLVGADKSRWEAADYVLLVGAPVIGLGGILAALYEGYTSVRDSLFPEKSRLAKSIRSQLPYPDEAPDVRELFAMVDQDIQENGQWFDRVAVGREWVLGDDVTAISRIRVVFGRDEIIRRRSNGRSQTTRVIELYILDDRKQVQTTGLRSPSELQALLSCLRLRAPAALFPPYSQYFDYCGKSDEEWAELEREFRLRKGRLEANGIQAGGGLPQQAQSMVLTRADGSVTSRVTPELLRQTLLDCLREGGTQFFFLTPSQPGEAEGHALFELQCVTTLEEGAEHLSDEDLAALGSVDLVLKVSPEQPGGAPERGFLLETGVSQGHDVLCAWLRGEAPELRGWTPVQLRTTQRAQPRQIQRKLSLTERTGATRHYTSFTRRDVELAGEGLVNGKYTMAALSIGAGYIYIQSGSKEDGRATVQASRADPDQLRLFETKCRDRQAREWLLELADGRFAPDFSQWKDVTKRVQNELKRAEKAK